MMLMKSDKYKRSKGHFNLVSLFVLLVAFVGCNSNNETAVAPGTNDDFFQEIALSIGLDFKHSIGDNELSNIVESSGAGAAFLDFDQDRFIDIYACNGTWVENLSHGEKPDEIPHNHLYRNLGNGTFEDVTEKAKVGSPWYSMGVTVGDYDNDGFPDIYPLKLNGANGNIKIGLLISENKNIEAKRGAEMAIQIANEEGGIDCQQFQLITRSMEGPWGTGSKEAVNLIFNENIWAIMGSHDGRNAHVVEQITAKTQIVFLSAWTGDPTLSQAFVPWFFNCVPNYIQQASVLIEEIYGTDKDARIVTITDTQYDSKSALKSFINMSRVSGNPDPVQLFYDNSCQSFDNLLNEIIKANVDEIVLFVQPSASLKIIKQLRQNEIKNTIYGALSIFGEDDSFGMDIANFEDVVLVCSAEWFGTNSLSFKNQYQKRYGRIPSVVAAYAFDGMNVIIEAIRNSGQDRGKLREAVSAIQLEGVTGMIQFDGNGNRVGGAELVQIK